MKTNKTQLKKLIMEELEKAQGEQQQLDENYAKIAGEVVKNWPKILQLIEILPQITDMVKSFGGDGASPAGQTGPDVSPATE